MSTEIPSTVDALVIGGGPAGLSAALWLGRYQRATLVVDAGRQRNLPAKLAHGIPGRDPVPPGELLDDMREQVLQYPEARIHGGTVTALRRGDDGVFVATLQTGETVIAARVVLAMGVDDKVPDLDGFEAHYGTDIHHCPACDGFEVRGQEVVVFGSGIQVPAFASELLDWARSVRIVSDTSGAAFDDEQRRSLDVRGIEVMDGRAAALVGEPGALEGVRLVDGTLVPGSAVFFSYAHQPAHRLATALGCAVDDDGQIAVDGFQLTSVAGVYAAGDITPGLQLVSIAMGKGVAAGIACATSLRGEDDLAAEPDPAPPTREFKPRRTDRGD